MMAVLPVAVLSCACREEPLHGPEEEKHRAVLEITVDPSLMRSASIADESRVNDLNIWIYSSSGLLREHHFMEISFNGEGSVPIDTRAGAGSRIVALANVGKAVEPPLEQDARISLTHLPSASDAVLMLGQGVGFDGRIMLCRVMGRLAIGLRLTREFEDMGAALGSNVHVSALRLCNAASKLSFVPSSAFGTARVSCAKNSSWLCNGDYLSPADISMLEGGGSVFLYALPNYHGTPVGNVPASGTELCTYIEMELSYDAFGNFGAGKAYHRFYVTDGSLAGVMGGCSYSLDVSITPLTAIPLWRKDDYRFLKQADFAPGTVRKVGLVQGKDSGNYWFSLSPDSLLSDDGVFRIEADISSGRTLGVKAESLAEGSSSLYVFNADPEQGATYLGMVELRSVLPEISAATALIDVTGEKCPVALSGLPGKEECASEAVWESFYGLRSVDFGPDGDFIGADVSDGTVYVRDIASYRSKVGREYEGNVVFRGGFSVSLKARITDRYVACLAQDRLRSCYNVESIDKPNATYRNYRNNSLTVSLDRPQPDCLAGLPVSGLGRAGWKSWIEGPSSYYEDADSRISAKTGNLMVWNFGYADFTSTKEGRYALKIGRLNPWCGDYVEATVSELDVVRFRVAGIRIRMDWKDDILTCSFAPNETAKAHGARIDTDAAFREKRPDVISELECMTGMPSGWRLDGDVYQVAFKVDTVSLDDRPMLFSRKYNDTANRYLFTDALGKNYPCCEPYREAGRHCAVSPFSGYMVDILSPYCFLTSGGRRYNTETPSLLRKEDCSEEAYFPWSEP